MGKLAQLLAPRPQSVYPADHDFYYESLSRPSASGVNISSETALSIATVYACVRIISSTAGMLPLLIMERRGRAKERAANHPLYDVVHDTPNLRQNSFQWRQTGMVHLLLRGAAYNRIIAGLRGPVDQLEPLNPDEITAELLENRRLRFRYRPKNGPIEMLGQDDVLFILGLSQDGVSPISVIQYARDSLGLTYAAENYGARLFNQGALHSGILKHPGRISDDARERLREEVRQRHMGLDNAHSPMLLQEGMEWQSITMTPDDAQFLLTRGFQVEEVCSWFGVPLSLVQHTEKSTSWGTGLSQLMLGFLIFTMQPWLTLWEKAIGQQLIIRSDRFFAEFLVEGLLRGDSAARSSFYQTMVNIMAMTPNEVRERENLNPLEGLDEPIMPLNTRQGSDGTAMAREMVIPDRYFSRALCLALDAAGKIVNNEIKAIKTIARKQAGDPEGWTQAVREFYQAHKADVAEILDISYDIAAVYCEGQISGLLERGIQVTERWEKDRPAQLAAIMLGGK